LCPKSCFFRQFPPKARSSALGTPPSISEYRFGWLFIDSSAKKVPELFPKPCFLSKVFAKCPIECSRNTSASLGGFNVDVASTLVPHCSGSGLYIYIYIYAHLPYIKGCPNSIANSLPSARCGGRPKAAIGDAGSCAIWRAAEGRLDAVALCLITMRFGFENIVLESSFVPNCD
jgi:hypothetical protein